MTKKTITYYEVRLDKHYYTVEGGRGSYFIPHVDMRKRLKYLFNPYLISHEQFKGLSDKEISAYEESTNK